MTAPVQPPSTTTQHALDGLRRAVVSGELGPGARVVQEGVAERLGVSIAVREALRVLEQEGQVTYRPRRGYFVTELRIETCTRSTDCGRCSRHGPRATRCRRSTRTRSSARPWPPRTACAPPPALSYDSAEERSGTAAAHERILEAVRVGGADRLVAELDAHRACALDVLTVILRRAAG